MKRLTYLTYQTFPSEKANSLQTISNIKYLVRNNVEVELIFPLREKNSNGNIENIKKYYSFSENFKVTGLSHLLPFGKVNFMPSLFFHISHFLWSYYVVSFKINKFSNDSYMTRSDWILYFLAIKGKRVIFECHQSSRIRSFVLKRVRSNKNVKIIFLNENLQKFYGMNNSNSTVLHNGVDPDIFLNSSNEYEKESSEIIFTGNLKRFEESRGLEFIIQAFKNSEFLQKHTLSIVGRPDEEAQELKKIIEKAGLTRNLIITGQINRSNIGSIYQNSKIGILINSSSNKHSYEFTSPLKYFEYVYANLTVVGVDFPSHRVLPESSKIIFFEENNYKSFELAIKKALTKEIKYNNFGITLQARAEKLISLLT